MMKRSHIFILFVCTIFCWGGYYFFTPSSPQTISDKKTLNVYTWLDFIPPSLQEKFEQQSGIKLHIDYIDSDEGLEAKLLTGKTEYDLVYPSTPYVFRHIQLGLYQPLDSNKLPNLKYIDSAFIEEFKSNGKIYSIPYLWGSSGFAYDANIFDSIFGDEHIDSWSYIFDPKKLKQIATKGIASTASGNELFCAIYLWLGHFITDITPQHIEALTQYARLARPYWRVFLSSESAIQALGTGEIALAFIWNGDAMAAQKLGALQGRKIRYVTPKEGALKWVDSLAIPHTTQNTEQAYMFINFLLEPQNMAEVTNYVQFANTSSYSKKFIRTEIINNLVLYPRPETMDKLILDKRTNSKIERTINRQFFKILVGY